MPDEPPSRLRVVGALRLERCVCVTRLRKANGVSSLRADKQKENEKLREALSRKAASLEHLQRELAAVRAEKERLQTEADGKESQNQRLLQEACHGRWALSR